MNELPQFVAFGEALTDMIRLGTDQWKSVPGGSPWNVAQVMACFGAPSAFGGAVSHDCFGEVLWQVSAKARLDMRFMQRVDKSPLLAIVHETQPPKYFFVGDDSADLHFDVAALPQGWENEVRWAHFGSISLARQPLANRLVALAERLKAQGVHISYDPNFRVVMDENYDPIMARMVAVADIIKVSEEDLRGLFRTDDEDASFAKLRAMNPAAAFLYTRGAEGAAMVVGDKTWRATPPQIKVIDSVGAGDTSLAGLLCSLMQYSERGWDEHLRASVAAGTGACLAAGATPPSQEILARLAKEVVLKSV
jgi:fructokinase